MRPRLPLLPAVLLLAACGEGGAFPPPPGRAPAPVDLEVVAFEQQGNRAVGRNEPLVLRFSAPLDPASLSAGSVRVLRGRSRREQPVTPEIRGDRLLLLPPAPFGFAPRTRYRVVVEGFPSLRALRSKAGRPLARRFRGSFGTSRFYTRDLVPPEVESLTLGEDESGAQSLEILFSEAVEPRSVEPGTTLEVENLDDGEELHGRLVPDREARFYRYLLSGAGRATAIRVTLTTGILDLAGNPLKVPDGDRVERVFSLVPRSRTGGIGEIIEDFSTTRMMDPGETTALWNDPLSPGVLRGDRRTTSLRLEGDPTAPEEPLPVGPEELRMRLLLGRQELGPPREITALALRLHAAAPPEAEYRDARIEITPTRRRRLGRRGLELGPPTVVHERACVGLDPESPDRLVFPFSRFYSYDGESNLLLEIRIGTGDHTAFLRARRARPGTASTRRGGATEPLRPLVEISSFSRLPVATSRFHDTGLDSPEYFAPILHPDSMPRDIRLELLFQGATRLDDSGRPPPEDPLATSGWVEDVRQLAGYRFVRFRATFTGVNLTRMPPELDDLILPYRSR